MEDSEKEEIRRRIDIVELISPYSPLKRTGRTLKGLCPFHQEKTPSFNVDPDRGRYKCFGCDESGDIFTFLMKAEGLTFAEAIEKLADKAGVTLSRRGMDREQSARLQNEKDRLYNANALATRFFRDCLRRDELPRKYVEGRGLVHETLEAHQIGWAPDDWSQLAGFLARNGVLAEDAVKAGLVFQNNHGNDYTDRFRARLIFPIFDTQERIVAFGGRLIEAKENAPKYLNSPETPIFVKSALLYGLNRARKSVQTEDKVLVVEGYMDVVACHQAGIENVVATLGTSLTERHIDLLRRYTKNVTLCFDADAAGERAALKAADLFRAAGQEFTLKILVLPNGDDPDSMLKRGDAPAFRRAIDGALTVPEFQLQAMSVRFDLKEDAGRLEYLRAAVPILAGIPSSLDRDRLVRKLAPYHPSYASGGSRAEESIREEIRRHQPFGPRDSDDYFGASPAPRQNAPYAPRFGRNGSQGNSPQTWGSGGSYNGQGSRHKGNWRNQPPPLPTPPPEARQSHRPAIAAAEELLVRAFLSDEWSRYAAKKLDGKAAARLLTDPHAVALAGALEELLVGHIAPSQAVAQLSDESLIDFADRYLMGEFDEPLSAEVIDGCIDTLYRKKIQTERREQLSSAPPTDDEALRRWAESAQATKRGEAQK